MPQYHRSFGHWYNSLVTFWWEKIFIRMKQGSRNFSRTFNTHCRNKSFWLKSSRKTSYGPFIKFLLALPAKFSFSTSLWTLIALSSCPGGLACPVCSLFGPSLFNKCRWDKNAKMERNTRSWSQTNGRNYVTQFSSPFLQSCTGDQIKK